MIDVRLGYCTNVHAGVNLEQAWANLREHAVAVREIAFPDTSMGVGLWFSNQAATDLLQSNQINALGDWLGKNQLLPYTFNGFPFGNFHQARVKHAVYHPTWYERPRLDYTLSLIEILGRLLPPGEFGSISTLPIAWNEPALTKEQITVAGQALGTVVSELEKREQATGQRIMLCLEPEPGCVLQFTADAIRWIDEIVPRESGLTADIVKRYLGLCHDVCHAAVMFEGAASSSGGSARHEYRHRQGPSEFRDPRPAPREHSECRSWYDRTAVPKGT